MSQTIDLSPGTVADPYKIPATDWAIVNKLVAVVLQCHDMSTTGVGAFYSKLTGLPNYQHLLTVAQAWKRSTFDALVIFASALSTFGATTVQGDLNQLGQLVAKLSLPQPDLSVKPQFDQVIQSLSQAMAELSSQASALVPVLKDFDTQMTQANVSGAGAEDPIWNVFSLNAGSAFDVVKGRLSTLSTNLSDLKTSVQQHLTQDMPIVIEIVDLPGTIQKWQEVGKLAAGFIAAAPQQRQYLTSDVWQYADPSLQLNSFQYRMVNQAYGDSWCLAFPGCNPPSYSAMPVIMAPQGNEGFGRQCWKFNRWQAGFYKLYNQSQPTLALGSYPNLGTSPTYQASMAIGEYTGQLWRFVPAGGGWYQMSNLALGETWALEVHGDTSLWLEKKAASAEQYFKIVPYVEMSVPR